LLRDQVSGCKFTLSDIAIFVSLAEPLYDRIVMLGKLRKNFEPMIAKPLC
jgi:hypothetical protein